MEYPDGLPQLRSARNSRGKTFAQVGISSPAGKILCRRFVKPVRHDVLWRSIPLLVQAALCALTLLLSVVAILPMSSHLSDSKGHCMLYLNGTFDNSDGGFVPEWGSPFYCHFSILTNLIIALMSAFHLVKYGILLYRDHDRDFIGAFFDCVISVALASLLLVSSFFVTGGFFTWCTTIEQRFQGCEDASVTEIHPADGVDTVGFYDMMTGIQRAQWTCWVCWMLRIVLSIRTLRICHERDNLIISMAREHEHLNAREARCWIVESNAHSVSRSEKELNKQR